MHATQALAASSNRWLILALLFACRTGLGFQFQTLGSVSSSLVAEFGLSNVEFGIAMAQNRRVWIDAHFDWRAAFLIAAAYCPAGAVAMFWMDRPSA